MLTYNDAGLLREYIAKHYGAWYAGHDLISVERSRSARHLVKRLARLVSITTAEVVADIVTDYQNAD